MGYVDRNYSGTNPVGHTATTVHLKNHAHFDRRLRSHHIREYDCRRFADSSGRKNCNGYWTSRIGWNHGPSMADTSLTALHRYNHYHWILAHWMCIRSYDSEPVEPLVKETSEKLNNTEAPCWPPSKLEAIPISPLCPCPADDPPCPPLELDC